MLIYFPFTDTTEARYAEIARKMVETNDWVTPQFDYGVPFWGKPPLHTWVSALGMKAFGVNEFGGRIFTYGTGLVLLTLLYQWVRQERGKNIALVGTVILTSSSLFFISMATVMTELVMITGTGLSMLAFWNSLHHARRRTLMGYLFFVGLAIGLLAKGPVAFVLTAIPIGVWVLLHNRWSETWEKLPWISGTLLMIAIAAPWYFLAEIKTPGFLRYFIVGEHFERFLVSGWEGDLYGAGHAKPKGTIWIMWLGTLFPWTPLLLLPLLRFKSVLSGIKQEKSKWSSYLICWTLAPLAFFSMATNVLPTYVITGLPACCFLLVEFWTHSHPKQTGPSSGSIRYFKGTALAAIVLFAAGFLVTNFLPKLAPLRTQRGLTSQLEQLDPTHQAKLYYSGSRNYSIQFYTGGSAIRFESPDELRDILADSQQDFISFPKNKFDQLPPDIRDRLELRGTFYKHLLLSEKPPTGKDLTHVQ
ncbi:glycosyltransferase family 39 protein [Akkermansiaceae bacterium]|nr:glycosyltransferase family 39 protein [Akkermansiaceae bacterium]